ncbi:MAG: Bifunctional NAD(P)H-hydrate repair enzyme Nnr [Burkholderia plantarii]|nr:MAG: Bifunctional NAD(P)H-hydrate repair enzyme Nnr [Burkholderia plantarii]
MTPPTAIASHASSASLSPLSPRNPLSQAPAGSDPFSLPLAHAPLPLASVADLRAAEASASAALPPHTLMARAGAAAARWIAARAAGDARAVWLAAGPGNNGGDALVAAAELLRLGIQVEVCLPVEPTADDARWALSLARDAGVPIAPHPPASLDAYGWRVDGLFGIGLARPLAGIFAQLAAQLSAHAGPLARVLALDLPSGIDADSGARVGHGPVVRATHTLSFLAAKPGLYLGDGRDHAGEVEIATLDAAPGHASATLNAAALFARARAPRTRVRSAAWRSRAATPACAARRSSPRAPRCTRARARCTSAFSATTPRPTMRRSPS